MKILALSGSGDSVFYEAVREIASGHEVENHNPRYINENTKPIAGDVFIMDPRISGYDPSLPDDAPVRVLPRMNIVMKTIRGWGLKPLGKDEAVHTDMLRRCKRNRAECHDLDTETIAYWEAQLAAVPTVGAPKTRKSRA